MKRFQGVCVGIALVGMMVATGCGGSGTTSQNVVPPQQNLQIGSVEVKEGGAIFNGQASKDGSASPDFVVATSNIQIEGNKWEVSLYFAAADGSGLMETRREVALAGEYSVEKLATAVIEALLDGSEDDAVVGIMPPGTKLQNVQMGDNNVLSVSLNPAFVEAQTGGTAGMMDTLYGLVNSLACIEEVDAVQILIDGEEVEAYEGMIAPGEPIEPNVRTK